MAAKPELESQLSKALQKFRLNQRHGPSIRCKQLRIHIPKHPDSQSKRMAKGCCTAFMAAHSPPPDVYKIAQLFQVQRRKL